jgi:hypothetical protein
VVGRVSVYYVGAVAAFCVAPCCLPRPNQLIAKELTLGVVRVSCSSLALYVRAAWGTKLHPGFVGEDNQLFLSYALLFHDHLTAILHFLKVDWKFRCSLSSSTKREVVVSS